MKKLLGFLVLSSLLLPACGGKNSAADKEDQEVKVLASDTLSATPEEAKAFALRFADSLSKGRTDSLVAQYPDMAKADKLVSDFSIDTTVNAVETSPGVFDITISPQITLTVTKDNSGNMTVASSKGLFDFDKAKLDAASKDGLIADSLSDAAIAEKLKGL